MRGSLEANYAVIEALTNLIVRTAMDMGHATDETSDPELQRQTQAIINIAMDMRFKSQAKKHSEQIANAENNASN